MERRTAARRAIVKKRYRKIADFIGLKTGKISGQTGCDPADRRDDGAGGWNNFSQGPVHKLSGVSVVGLAGQSNCTRGVNLCVNV